MIGNVDVKEVVLFELQFPNILIQDTWPCNRIVCAPSPLKLKYDT